MSSVEESLESIFPIKAGEIIAESGLESKPIWITADSFRHIMMKHDDQLKKDNGFEPLNFVLDVCEKYDHIFKGAENSIIIAYMVKENRWGLAAVEISHTVNGDYVAKSAYIGKHSYLKEKNLIWKKGRHSASGQTQNSPL